MVRTPVLLGLLALAQARSPAAELPVITNGSRVTRADDPLPAPAPALPLPVITNEPMAPKPAKAPQPRIVVPYTVGAIADDVGPVTYNAYYAGPYAGIGYGYPNWVGGYGYGYGWAGWGYGANAYPPYGPWYGYGPWGVGRPPRIELLDTGIRHNVGSLVSMPFPAPVYGSVLGVYYRR